MTSLEAQEVENSGSKLQEKKGKLSLRIHELAQDCQNLNGLRHGDHEQYRQYCTRRLKKLRSSRDVRLMFGKGKTFVKKELTADMVTTTRHLEIPLMMAERAWSYAKQLKQETAGAPFRVRRHAAERLAKAAKWASDLEALCLETSDDRTCLEAAAYSSWMTGNLLLERYKWREALDRLLTAHRICDELAKVGRVEDQDLFSRRVEEIEPMLRYCRYNIDSPERSTGDGAQTDAETADTGGGGVGNRADALAARLESVVAEAREKQSKAVDSVEWRGRRVTIRSEAVRKALARADKLAGRRAKQGVGAKGSKKSSKKKEPAEGAASEPTSKQYVKVFGAYDDALSKIAEELSKLQGKGGGMKMEAHRAELESLRRYAQHHKLSLMVRRYERVVRELHEKRRQGGSSVRPGDAGQRDRVAEAADIVHVYDALLQSVRGLVANMGAGEDAEDDAAEEEDELLESVKADEARFRAFRCYFVVEALSAGQKWTEASALFDHTRTLCQEAVDMLEDGDSRAESLAELENMIEGAWHRAAAQALLTKAKQDAALSSGLDGISIGGSVDGRGRRPRAGRSLQDTLVEFDVGRGSDGNRKEQYRIADLPPSMPLVPCKPRLLDLAFDELEFPDLDQRAGIEKVVEASGDEGARGGGGSGITGLVGWALGWKSDSVRPNAGNP